MFVRPIPGSPTEAAETARGPNEQADWWDKQLMSRSAYVCTRMHAQGRVVGERAGRV